MEAWVPGRGWSTFDPTPPDPNPGSVSLLTKLALYADAAETFWQEWVVSYDLGHQATLADKMEQTSRSAGSRWFRRTFELAKYWKDRAAWWFLHYGLWALGAAAAPACWWYGSGRQSGACGGCAWACGAYVAGKRASATPRYFITVC